ncbi:MAG: amino acid adenylation domain-containing protein [Planctomycetaceae bacterium]
MTDASRLLVENAAAVQSGAGPMGASTADSDAAIHDRFEAFASESPDRPAIKTPAECLTFSRLNRESNRAARALLARSLHSQLPLAVLIEQGASLAVGILAVLKTGRCYVALKPTHPSQRTAFILDDSRADILLTNTRNLSLATALAGDRIPIVNIDTIDPTISSERIECAVSPDCYSSITYTSGSTGKPKGVIHTHRSTLHLGRAAGKANINQHDRVIAVGSSLSFNRVLINGAGAYPWIVREQAFANLAEWMESEAITVLLSVPTVFRNFVATLSKRQRFPHLRRVILTGETLYRSDVELFRAHFPSDCVLVNELGCTETKTYVQYVIDRGTTITGEIVPVGYALEGKGVEVLDGDGNDAGIEQVGEIAVRSRHLSPGYWRRPELTSARFRPDPDASHERIYLTGDLGYRLPGGCLVHVGRKDWQLKIRGQRVELAEIEAALRQLDSIHDAVVVAREDRPGDKRLVAYFVARQGPAPTSATLRQLLSQSLPDYMVPAAFVQMDALPVTPNGKVDRLSLPDPTLIRPARSQAYAAPQTDIERQVTLIWRELFSTETIGIHDNFFELGGHSLLATQLIARVRNTFGIDLPIHSVFEGPTIEELAARIGAAHRPEIVPSRRALEPVVRDGKMPLSFAQQRLWFLEQLQGERVAYNLHYGLRLRGRLDPESLRRALETVVERHEPLRASIRLQAGRPVQAVQAAGPFDLRIVDLRDRPASEVEGAVLARRRAAAELPFDLTKDRLLRGELLRLAENDQLLLLTFHHMATDGWSMPIFWSELECCYAAHLRQVDPPLPKLPIRYADFAAWQRQELQGERFDQLLNYWRANLHGLAPLDLPADRARPPIKSYQGARHTFDIPREVVESLQTLSRAERATLHMTLLAAFQALLARDSGQADIAVGVPIAGRQQAELELLIGFFVNTLVLRTDLADDPTFRQLLDRVRSVSLDAYDHQDLPFERLVEELQPQRDLSRSPLFDVLFELRTVPDRDLSLGDLEVTRLPGVSRRVRFDVEMHLRASTQGLHGTIAYSTDLFNADTIARMARRFQTLLTAIAEHPDERVSRFPLLTDEQRRQIVVEWNRTATDYPREKLVHQLFEEQTERTPEALALVCGDRQLSYRDLNARANRLAHYLAVVGVSPGQPVVVLMGRSVEFVVSVLAILKAGGAYVPLETNAPPTRLRTLIRDTGAKVVLTCAPQQVPGDLPDLRTVLLDDPALHLKRQPDDNPALNGAADAIAYVMYTSGSTGLPKGVLVPHRGIVRLVCGAAYVPFGQKLRFLWLASPAFDASTFELWGALLHGSACVIYPERVPDLGDLERLLREQQINCLWLTSSFFNILVDSRPELLAGVSHLIIGGEALSVDHVRKFRLRHPQVTLINGYGPTETTTFACTYPIPPELPADWTSIPIGRPIANTEAYVLDAARQPVAIGVAGELHIGGDGLARGYLNRRELTSEKFIPHPFRSSADALLYRTGDLVRWREDGNLEFLGRRDQQVKLRGFRIELGEIEATLTGNPAVAQAVVLLRDDNPGEKRLVAYVVAADRDARPTAATLRGELLKQLPEYMVPATYVHLERLPLTPNGKVDRQALPAPQIAPAGPAAASAALNDSIETQLMLIWEDLLATRPIQPDDNFFDLGGHSLLAVRLLSRVAQVFNQTVPLRALFLTPTVRGMARLLRDREERAWPTLIPIQPHGSKPPLFCVAAPNVNALGFVFLARRLGPGQPVYGLQRQDAANPERYYTEAQYEALAAASIVALNEVWPAGPCLLCGFCEGSHIAVEMARQLTAVGREVGLLAVFDAWPVENTTSRWRVHLLGICRRLRRDELSAAFRAVRRKIGRLTRHVTRKRSAEESDISQADASAAASWNRWKQRMWPGQDFVPPVYDGRITVFRVRRQPWWRVRDDSLGWKARAAQGVDVHEVPGEHQTILREPHVEVLAARLTECISLPRR